MNTYAMELLELVQTSGKINVEFFGKNIVVTCHALEQVNGSSVRFNTDDSAMALSFGRTCVALLAFLK